MRVSVRGVLFIAIVVGTLLPSPATAGQAATAKPILKPDQGFSLSVPAGWAAAIGDPEAAAAIARTDNRQVKARVFVRREAQPTTVTETLTAALSAIRSMPGQKLVSSSFDVHLERAALFAVYEDATTRYRLVMVPRDYEEQSQVYYTLTVAAPKTAFAKLAAAFDRVFAGFAILDDMKRTAETPDGSPPPVAAPVPSGFDRNAAIERILSPHKRPGG